MGAWLPSALSLPFCCRALRAVSPHIPFPPVIQSFSSCSRYSLTQKHQPLLGPGRGCCCLSCSSPFPTWLSAPFPISSCGGRGTTSDLCTPTTASCHLKHQSLTDGKLVVEATGIWGSLWRSYRSWLWGNEVWFQMLNLDLSRDSPTSFLTAS